MEKIKDLNDLYNSAHAFQTIFSQLIINDTINGKTEIVIIENGSICIDIYVGSLQAVTYNRSQFSHKTLSILLTYSSVYHGRSLCLHRFEAGLYFPGKIYLFSPIILEKENHGSKRLAMDCI